MIVSESNLSMTLTELYLFINFHGFLHFILLKTITHPTVTCKYGKQRFLQNGDESLRAKCGRIKTTKTIKYAQLTTVLIESILCVPTTLFDSTDRKDATDLID